VGVYKKNATDLGAGNSTTIDCRKNKTDIQ
jgi:hypothetical protein